MQIHLPTGTNGSKTEAAVSEQSWGSLGWGGLTFLLLELLLREAHILVVEVGQQLLVLLLQLGNLGQEVLRLAPPHILHQLQLLSGRQQGSQKDRSHPGSHLPIRELFCFWYLEPPHFPKRSGSPAGGTQSQTGPLLLTCLLKSGGISPGHTSVPQLYGQAIPGYRVLTIPSHFFKVQRGSAGVPLLSGTAWAACSNHSGSLS